MSTQKKKDTKDLTKKGMNRRDFIKTTVATTVGGSLIEGMQLVGPSVALAAGTPVKTICPYCSVGCGMTVVPNDGGTDVIDIYGDSDHVVSRGALCSKGSAAIQMVNSTQRITTPMRYDVDALGVGTWTTDSWANAMTDIATKLTTARGAVSGTDYNSKSVAFLGCANATNEENYLYRKLIANFGTNNIEHQARI